MDVPIVLGVLLYLAVKKKAINSLIDFFSLTYILKVDQISSLKHIWSTFPINYPCQFSWSSLKRFRRSSPSGVMYPSSWARWISSL